MWKTSQYFLQRSIDNIRYKQIKEKVDLEAELEHNKRYLGSPLPAQERVSYLANIGRAYAKSRLSIIKLF